MRVNRWNIALAAIAVSWGFVSMIVAGVDLGGEELVFWRCLLAALTLPPLLLVLPRGWQVALGGAAVLAAGTLVVLYEEPAPAAPEAPAGVTMFR